ncbi:MAG: dienelactone hydrolase [Candidatus Muproteobacteria bacterium RIFCSPHIGHO2_12_FULL_60_33]|uniref:Dienelactone hydrolase n=1 Tax=Candidatus Muproteobacteria bacterium RIFCSPLOWO2_01_FULL_60_18 TaxID=1817768 RepID=A0A1F6U5S8_9PROT|nr:MAG: dienelactone hydrolase [Candidatus Muproteobacteria bacterium RIFCSPLOWO2_01_FULL_60_18]OGI53268.1 MAG: dienelactone hydrolase [Candidatus Muproteobacteria bacterium RIFCSPHIGHO2_01_60_12]OGI53886.1 MAG: dienelactone hydrolase [Candidatus Muproteobacteria bacterium RIFCSPHIGHO2_02_FULL_60_13]OGI56323.1 MAG: dienelactone hydrolase [Candidatus Muproteobacteria bacterium RIFCSPHIGHO2_12_FULL_60_33]OGI59265.1 MAG: dienelactone hydrolase [Candidatus Muproteobacteria bacterium RIFCSPHIGHO2_01
MRRWVLFIVLAFSGIVVAQAAIKGEPVEYKAGDTVLKGYLVYDDATKERRPGVLVAHEWWGHDRHARNSARKLAEAGYVALALDMYGGGKQADHPEHAGKFSGEVRQNLPLMKSRFEAGMKLLRNQSRVDVKRLAAIGYCFGGSVVLEMARAGESLRGVASFHGGLTTEHPAPPGKVKARVLVLNGAEDPFVPVEQIAAFKKEMEGAKVNYKFVNYPGAKHSFTNPDADANGVKFKLPLAYDAKADQASWSELQSFLQLVFK